jgi:FixJ family two-component response regulator
MFGAQTRCAIGSISEGRHGWEGNMTSSPTLYIVDADAATAEAISPFAQAEGIAIERYASAAEFLSNFRGDPPGCLVADIGLAGLSYDVVAAHLASQGSKLPVIALAWHADVPLAVSVLRRGALTLLEKPCASNELWQSVTEALAHDALQRQRRQQQEATRQRYAALNDDERRVLSLLVAGHANKMIASQLKIGLRTVELRRAAVLRKMNANSVAELVRMAIEIGIQ